MDCLRLTPVFVVKCLQGACFHVHDPDFARLGLPRAICGVGMGHASSSNPHHSIRGECSTCGTDDR